jgi:tetratricopeptide (TPR) repeat protein
MRSLADTRIRPRLLQWALVIAAAWLAAACATSGTGRPAPREVRDVGGFTITENVRVGFGARADFERAMRLLEQERYDEGIALLAGVTEAAPWLTTAHINLAIAYRRVDDLERAAVSLEKALELNPRHPAALNEQGILRRRMGRFEEARASYEKALAAYPDFHFAQRNLAILCDLFLADAGCALEHYELYLQLVPDDKTVAMWIADLRNRTDR